MKRVVYVLALLHSTPEQLHDKRSPHKKFYKSRLLWHCIRLKVQLFVPNPKSQSSQNLWGGWFWLFVPIKTVFSP